MLGRIVGHRWTALGAFLNTVSLTYVTHLTERRIKLSSPERLKEYRYMSVSEREKERERKRERERKKERKRERKRETNKKIGRAHD